MVTWNLNDIYEFKDTNLLLTKINKIKDKMIAFRPLLTEDISEKDFLAYFKLKEELVDLSSKLGAYAELWLSENTSDAKRNAHSAKISEQLTDIGNELLFFGIWFKKISNETAERLIGAAKEYEYMLRRSRAFKEYTLEEREEQITNLKDLTGSEALSNLYDIITNKFKWDFEGETKSQQEMTLYYRHHDRDLRKKAYEAVLSKFGEEEAVLGEIYKNLANDWRNENVKLRGFKNPIAVRDLANDIPSVAVENLLATTRKNIGLFTEYFTLKFKELGIAKPARYDIYAPREKKEKQYSYAESKQIVLDTYSRFSERMGVEAKKIFDENHIHSDLKPNKRSGAFCYTVQNDITPYILLNFTEKQDDVFTMMHEVGHGIHGLLGSKQNKFSFHSCIPLAETASIFGENLLNRRLFSEADSEEKKTLLMNQLDKYYGSIARQAYFVLFEKDAFDAIERGATIDELNDLYMKNLKEQFGDALSVPDYFKHEWKYIPHIYHSPFYCYGYSFGNLLVLSLWKEYEKQGDAFIPKYLKILEYGGSKAPVDILKEAGFDITTESFWQGGYDVIREELEELKKLL